MMTSTSVAVYLHVIDAEPRRYRWQHFCQLWTAGKCIHISFHTLNIIHNLGKQEVWSAQSLLFLMGKNLSLLITLKP